MTTNLNINSLNRPEPRDLTAQAHLIRSSGSAGEVEILSEASSDMAAHAIATYALPAA